MFQLSDVRQSREQAREEVKEKEEEKQQMKEGLRAALEEMSKLNLLLQVQHIPAPDLRPEHSSMQVTYNTFTCVFCVTAQCVRVKAIFCIEEFLREPCLCPELLLFHFVWM